MHHDALSRLSCLGCHGGVGRAWDCCCMGCCMGLRHASGDLVVVRHPLLRGLLLLVGDRQGGVVHCGSQG